MTLAVDVAATVGADGSAFAVDAAFAVEPGETLVVLGPSGSGKSLLLETLAGFHPHDGRVALDDRDLTRVPPERRDFGFVFQDYALFPHLSVRENVRFGERYRETARDADDLLAELGVGDLAPRMPPTLSGGEAQRVALARALLVRPSVLLLDEPLSSLDVPTRRALRDDLLGVLEGVTAVYVTHNRTTARVLGDRIAVMRDGRLVQVGTPEAVFESPATPFVATFTGSNVLPVPPGSPERAALGDVPADATHLAVRPEHLAVDGGAADLEAVVERVTREDAAYRLRLRAGEHRLDAYVDDPPTRGTTVGVALPPDRRTYLAAGGDGAP